MPAKDLEQFLAAFTKTRKPTASAKRRQAGAPAPTRAEPPPRKVDSPLWISERIVYLATTTHCACGATSTQTNPIPLVRRYHPRYGIHEEAIQVAHKSPMLDILPSIVEHRNIDIANCHECFGGETPPNPFRQLTLEF